MKRWIRRSSSRVSNSATPSFAMFPGPSGATEMTELRSMLLFPRIASGMTNITPLAAVEQQDVAQVRKLKEATTKPDFLAIIKKDYLLHKAIETKNNDMLFVLIEESNPETLLLKDVAGRTALHCAVRTDNQDAALALMKAHSKTLTAKDCDGNTPFHVMVKNQLYDMCERAEAFLNPDVINHMNSQNRTSLHLAARGRADKILQLLIRKGGNVAAKTGKSRWTPLHYAADSGSDVCVTLLLNAIDDEGKRDEYKNSKTLENYTALMYATRKGFSACSRALSGTDPNIAGSDGQTALHLAAKKGFYSLLVHLIKIEHANPFVEDKKHQTPLHHSILSNSADCFDYLLTRLGNEPDSNLCQDLLKLATKKNSYQCLNQMLERKAFAKHINHQFDTEENNTLLHISAASSNFRTTQKLLDIGASKNIKNGNGIYPLHLMASQTSAKLRSHEEERLEVCKNILRESHELVEVPDELGRTPLMLASKSGNIDMVKSLLYKGSKILRQDVNNATAVHIAAEAGNELCLTKIFRFLNTSERQELSKHQPHPLHSAAQNGHLQCCQILLKELKIDTKAKNSLTMLDNDDFYPVDLAHQGKHHDVFWSLLSQMEFDEEDKEFGCRIHRYFKHGIACQDMSVLNAIIASKWSRVIFDSCYCDKLREPLAKCKEGENVHANVTPCDSFSLLIRKFPAMASEALDRHIYVQPNSGEEFHDYTPFEYIYYCIEGSEVKSPFTSHKSENSEGQRQDALQSMNSSTISSPNSPATPTTPSSPLLSFTNDKNTNQATIVQTHPDPLQDNKAPPFSIKKETKTFRFQKWGRNHPLQEAIQGCNFEILNHKLTRSWLTSKYDTYARWILYAYVVLEILTVVFLSALVAVRWNPHHLQQEYPGTKRADMIAAYDDVYNTPHNASVTAALQSIQTSMMSDSSCSFADTLHPELVGWTRAVCALYHLDEKRLVVMSFEICVILLGILHVTVAIVFFAQLPKRDFLSSFRVFRMCHLLLLFISIIPCNEADFYIGLRNEIMWQIDIMAVLFGWLKLIGIVNKIPSFNIFMPLSSRFFLSYLLVVFHILLFIMAFALSFHFLLMDNAAFSSFPRSIIKTLVWMLGDLGYDDTFLDDDVPVVYEIQTNILFVLFVTFIGGLAFNLIIRNPTDQLQEIKDNADFHRAEGFLNLHLLIDDCIPHFRRKYARKLRLYSEDKKGTATFYSSCQQSHFLTEGESDADEEKHDDIADVKGELKSLSAQLESQKSDIRELTRKIASLTEHLSSRSSQV